MPEIRRTHGCYDFPLVVMHASDGTCPRYNGGVCRPNPEPTLPYKNFDEDLAVRAYQELVTTGLPGVVFEANGTTGPVKGSN